MSSFVFLCTPDSPAIPTSCMTVSDMTSLENSSHASSSGSCIPLMRSVEHFWKASNSAVRGVASLFSNLKRVALGERRPEGGQSKYVIQEAGTSSIMAPVNHRAAASMGHPNLH